MPNVNLSVRFRQKERVVTQIVSLGLYQSIADSRKPIIDYPYILVCFTCATKV